MKKKITCSGYNTLSCNRWVHSLEVIWIRISDPRSVSGSWCIKRTGESMIRVDSPVPLMHHDPDRSWITDPDPDQPKGMQP